MNKLLLVITIIQIWAVQTAFSQRAKKVSATLILPIEDSDCVGDFKQRMIRQAQIQAMAEEFGTVVQQGTDMATVNRDTGENVMTDTKFTSLSSAQVKGEWISTIEENLEWVLKEEDKRQVLYLKCEVKGKARKIEETPIAFEARSLSCNQIGSCETTTFKDLQSLYVSFKSPVKGYLSIYMRENDEVFRLFPYTSMRGEHASSMAVDADKEYVLFSPKHAKAMGLNAGLVDELQLSTMGESRLFNRVYVVFSPDSYKKPILKKNKDGMDVLSPEDFDTWLGKNKGMIKDFQDKVIYISVEQ